MNREEAIRKATKLLRLAASSNVHEAALAEQRAREILARFGLAPEDVAEGAAKPRA